MMSFFRKNGFYVMALVLIAGILAISGIAGYVSGQSERNQAENAAEFKDRAAGTASNEAKLAESEEAVADEMTGYNADLVQKILSMIENGTLALEDFEEEGSMNGTAEASAKDAAAAENESAEVAEDEPEADTEEAEMAGNVLNAGYSSENAMSWPVLYYFSGNEKSSLVQVFSVLDVIRKIHEKYPMLEVENIGEPDFVIRYVPDPEKKSVQYLKTALVCVILFFGSAFTIMTFIEDVSVNKVFNALYTRVTGQVSNGAGVLEICFCIGLAIGIMVFYNHVGTKKITDDPTPIQVAMRKYEQDVDTTYIETSSRKGKSKKV